MNSPGAVDFLDGLRDRIAVGPAPVGAIIAGGRARRRRQRGALVALAACVAAGVLAVSQLAAPDRSTDVVDLPTIGVPWWSDGVLHLPTGDVEVDAVNHFLPLPGGAVAGTRDGAVWLFDGDERRDLGPKDPATNVLHDETTGWVAWVNDVHEIVVIDPANGDELGRQPTLGWGDSRDFLIAFQDGVLFFDNRNGNREWDVRTNSLRALGDGASYLMDVAGTRRVLWPVGGDGTTMVVVEGDTELWRRPWAGRGPAVLSPGGDWVVHVQGTHEVVVLDAGTGASAPSGLPAGAKVRDLAFGSDDTVTYLVRDGERWAAVDCTLGAAPDCRVSHESDHRIVLPDAFGS